VLLKKSYDYFKTLKAMSDCICNAYNFVRNPDRYRKEILLFNANRTELSRSLSEEFVAPIERNDIYNISSCLSREIQPLDYICFLNVTGDLPFRYEDLSDLLVAQGEMILRLSDRNFIPLLDDVSSVLNDVNKRRIKIISISKDVLNKGQNVLLKYTLFERYLRFIENITCTFDELERVIINNT
jgi:hypothetical protein